MTLPREPTLPFSQIPQWPMLAPISAGAKVLYVLLVMHVNREDASNRTAWPSRASLARLAGYARPQTMDPYIEELEKLGAVVVDRGRHPSQPLRKRNTYRVALAGDPAPAGVGDLSLTDYYKRLAGESAGQPRGAVQRTSEGLEAAKGLAEPFPEPPEVRSGAPREVRPSASPEVRPTAQELDEVDEDEGEIDELSPALTPRAGDAGPPLQRYQIRHYCGEPDCIAGSILTDENKNGIKRCDRPSIPVPGVAA